MRKALEFLGSWRLIKCLGSFAVNLKDLVNLNNFFQQEFKASKFSSVFITSM